MDAGCPLGIGIGIARVNFNLAESRKHSIPFWQIFQHLVNGTGSLLSRCSWNLTRTIEANDARCPGKKGKKEKWEATSSRNAPKYWLVKLLELESRGFFHSSPLFLLSSARCFSKFPRNILSSGRIKIRALSSKYNSNMWEGGKFVEILVWIRARSIVISNNDRESHWCDKWGFKFTKVCVSLTRETRMKLWKITSRSRREPEWKDFNISRVRPSTLERHLIVNVSS